MKMKRPAECWVSVKRLKTNLTFYGICQAGLVNNNEKE